MRASPITVAVFGSSEPAPGSPPYREAEEVGRLLARAGYVVVNGGYGGVMEASARGAREAGGSTVGVTTRVFQSRGSANRFIDREIQEPDLLARTGRLVEEADAFVVLPGKSGTLAEWAFLMALRRSDLLGSKPVVLMGDGWGEILQHLRHLEILGEPECAACHTTDTPEMAVSAVIRCLKDSPPL